MRIEVPLYSAITLAISSEPVEDKPYPTSRIQKGLILYQEGKELCEEAVGFGVPILKLGLRTIFPGQVDLTPLDQVPTRKIRARFRMNLEERMSWHTSTIRNPIIYQGKNFLAALIRRLPLTRRLLTHSSSLLRASLDWRTVYEPGKFSTDITMTYSIFSETGMIKVELETGNLEQLGVKEVIVMNEQGAHHFDHYHDSDGVSLRGEGIGCWDRVTAQEAAFISHAHRVSFNLNQQIGAALYRGRELIANRLAWSGFGYSFPPSLGYFNYDITVKSSR